MENYLTAASAAETQAQIAAHRANLAKKRATRVARHKQINLTVEATAAIESLNRFGTACLLARGQMGGAL